MKKGPTKVTKPAEAVLIPQVAVASDVQPLGDYIISGDVTSYYGTKGDIAKQENDDPIVRRWDATKQEPVTPYASIQDQSWTPLTWKDYLTFIGVAGGVFGAVYLTYLFVN